MHISPLAVLKQEENSTFRIINTALLPDVFGKICKLQRQMERWPNPLVFIPHVHLEKRAKGTFWERKAHSQIKEEGRWLEKPSVGLGQSRPIRFFSFVFFLLPAEPVSYSSKLPVGVSGHIRWASRPPRWAAIHNISKLNGCLLFALLMLKGHPVMIKVMQRPR